MNPTHDWERELSETPVGFGGFSTQTMRKVKERIAVMERRTNRRPLAAALAVLTSLAILGVVFRDQWTGWLAPGTETGPAWPEEEEEIVTLRVDFFDGPSFHIQYGDAFVIRHPSVRFETIPADRRLATPEAYAQWARENQIDLLCIPLAFVDDLSRDGLLLPLDPLIAHDGFDLGKLYGPVVNAIREAGAGTLYGLAPTFNAYALYYNKSLFEEHGVPLPADGMHWDDVLNTAARFAGLSAADGQPVYGLSFGEGWRPGTAVRALDAGLHQGLQIAGYDASGKLVPSLDTPSWRAWWEKVAEGLGTGAIYDAKPPETQGNAFMSELYPRDAFLTGRSAMAYGDHYFIHHIREAARQNLFTDEWGVVALSASAAGSGATHGLSVSYVFAINAASPFADKAWEWLKFTHGEDQRHRELRSEVQTLHVNMAAADREDGPDAIFYQLQADPAAVLRQDEWRSKADYQALYAFLTSHLDTRLQDVAAGRRTAENMLEELQQLAETVRLHEVGR